ncbi:myb-like protein X [Condylostylus longicornis]|uniref:myb-like protein X n=1 Tax=Condylostylus longicornis TaxID=2530218 RepID=UPI00244DC0A0|nr:myb-like protein X [Condylostylus longicornis]
MSLNDLKYNAQLNSQSEVDMNDWNNIFDILEQIQINQPNYLKQLIQENQYLTDIQENENQPITQEEAEYLETLRFLGELLENNNIKKLCVDNSKKFQDNFNTKLDTLSYEKTPNINAEDNFAQETVIKPVHLPMEIQINPTESELVEDKAQNNKNIEDNSKLKRSLNQLKKQISPLTKYKREDTKSQKQEEIVELETGKGEQNDQKIKERVVGSIEEVQTKDEVNSETESQLEKPEENGGEEIKYDEKQPKSTVKHGSKDKIQNDGKNFESEKEKEKSVRGDQQSNRSGGETDSRESRNKDDDKGNVKENSPKELHEIIIDRSDNGRNNENQKEEEKENEKDVKKNNNDNDDKINNKQPVLEQPTDKQEQEQEQDDQDKAKEDENIKKDKSNAEKSITNNEKIEDSKRNSKNENTETESKVEKKNEKINESDKDLKENVEVKENVEEDTKQNKMDQEVLVEDEKKSKLDSENQDKSKAIIKETEESNKREKELVKETDNDDEAGNNNRNEDEKLDVTNVSEDNSDNKNGNSIIKEKNEEIPAKLTSHIMKIPRKK